MRRSTRLKSIEDSKYSRQQFLCETVRRLSTSSRSSQNDGSAKRKFAEKSSITNAKRQKSQSDAARPPTAPPLGIQGNTGTI